MLRWSRTTTLLLLATAACLQQARYVVRATLPAQDAVDVVSVAQRFAGDGPAALRSERASPLFPALVAAMHELASRVGWIAPSDWASPPQWVAAAAMVLAVWPVFLSTERLAGRNAAATATTLLIALPGFARLGGDGLGDAVHLCLVAWGVWFLIVSRWFVAGLCIAAALLVRPEAAIVPAAVFVVAVFRPELRVPRFFIAASLWLVPYLAVGVTSPSELVERLRGSAAPTDAGPMNDAIPMNDELRPHADAAASDDASTERRYDFGRKDADRSSRFHGLAATLHEYGTELTQAFGFVLLPLIVWGLFVVRRREGHGLEVAIGVALTVAVAAHLAIVFVMAWRGGYLSTRHFALPVLLTLSYAAVGLDDVCRRLAASRWNRFEISNLKLQIVAVVAFVIASLATTSAPLHESQRAHRYAAAWLASAASRPGAVLDQQGYTALYTGRPTYRFAASEAAFADSRLRYVVVERGDLEADTPRGAALRNVLGPAAAAVAQFAAPRDRRPRDVLVFERPTNAIAAP